MNRDRLLHLLQHQKHNKLSVNSAGSLLVKSRCMTEGEVRHEARVRACLIRPARQGSQTVYYEHLPELFFLEKNVNIPWNKQNIKAVTLRILKYVL